MITPEENVLLDNLNKARTKAESTKAQPCTPESHSAIVDVIVQQTDLLTLSYKKTDTLVDSLNKFIEDYATKIAPPKSWSDVAKVFILKAPLPFAFIVVAVICWFMYSNVKPKDLAEGLGKDVVSHVEER